MEAGVPEPGCLKESCSSVMQKLLPHFTEEETEAPRGLRTCPRAHSWGRSWEGVSQQGAEAGGAARTGHFPPSLPHLTAALLPALCSRPSGSLFPLQVARPQPVLTALLLSGREPLVASPANVQTVQIGSQRQHLRSWPESGPALRCHPRLALSVLTTAV